MWSAADAGHATNEGENGEVTLAEIVANIDGVDGSAADQSLFAAVDHNGDGRVSKAEFETFIQYHLINEMTHIFDNDGNAAEVSPAEVAESIRELILRG